MFENNLNVYQNSGFNLREDMREDQLNASTNFICGPMSSPCEGQCQAHNAIAVQSTKCQKLPLEQVRNKLIQKWWQV